MNVSLVLTIAKAVAVEGAKIAAIGGAVNTVLNFTARRINKVPVNNDVEFNNVVLDFARGAVNTFKDDPIVMVGLTVAKATAKTAPVVSAVATGVVVVKVGFDTVRMAVNVVKEVRTTKAEQREQSKKDHPAAKPPRMKLDVNIDAELFTNGSNARAYGYSWYEENFKGKGVPLKDVRDEARKALMRVQVASPLRVAFLKGLDEAATA
jgi:hypothetical protein